MYSILIWNHIILLAAMYFNRILKQTLFFPWQYLYFYNICSNTYPEDSSLACYIIYILYSITIILIIKIVKKNE